MLIGKPLEIAVAALIGLMVLAFLFVSTITCDCNELRVEEGLPVVHGEVEDPELEALAHDIQTLQPDHDDEEARRIAAWFLEGAEENNLDPKLLVAMSFRESGLRYKRVVGDLGEVGLMQVHGAALSARPEGCSPELESPRCQVRTGAAWLSVARQTCGDNMWDYVFAYGAGRCPRSAEEARSHHSPRNARRHYLKIGGVGWES